MFADDGTKVVKLDEIKMNLAPAAIALVEK